MEYCILTKLLNLKDYGASISVDADGVICVRITVILLESRIVIKVYKNSE